MSFAETVGINSFNLKNIWVRKYFDDGEIFECNNHVLISSLVSQKWTRKSVSLDMLKIFQKYFQPKLFEVYKNVECNNDDEQIGSNLGLLKHELDKCLILVLIAALLGNFLS